MLWHSLVSVHSLLCGGRVDLKRAKEKKGFSPFPIYFSLSSRDAVGSLGLFSAHTAD